jgi:tetratricopeptide (TPR) repeat protein
MEVFSKIIEADPYFPLAYELVGKINEMRGRLDEAIRYYKHGYDLDQRGDIAAKLANLYIDIGDFESADEWIAAAVAHPIGPDRTYLEWLQISALTARGEQAAARALMRPLLEVVTPDIEAYLNAAVAGYYLSEPQAVIAAWENAQRMSAPGAFEMMREQNLDATIGAAHAYAEAGRSADSAALLERLETWLDEQIASHMRVNPELWFVKARADAIKGEQGLALFHLQRAINEGWRQHWRPAAEPCFAALRERPAFQSMMAGLAVRMDLMREQLAFDSSFASASAG